MSVVKITREKAESIVEKYLGVFKYLDLNNIDYCCCRGLAVILYALQDEQIENFRETKDLDIFLPDNFSVDDIKEMYIAVYAKDSTIAEFIYDKMFGEGTYQETVDELFDEFDFGNNSFKGANIVPDLDALRWLNGKTLETLNVEKLNFKGYKINVASKQDLLEMKESTARLYNHDLSIRPQDYIDIKFLKSLVN